MTKLIDRTKAPYGLWAVTEAEYQKARALAAVGDEDAFQLVRYCQGSIFCRDDAMLALKVIREHPAA